MAESAFYVMLASPLGRVAIVWHFGTRGPEVLRVVLGNQDKSARAALRLRFPRAVRRTCLELRKLQESIERFLAGEPVRIGLGLAALHRCSDFQRKVLRFEHGIPRGRVSTYNCIAHGIGSPGAARAVGNALANNPFPLIVPCHRAIRSNGELGGFQGGPRMKRALLELEGVKFAPDGRIAGFQAWSGPDTRQMTARAMG